MTEERSCLFCGQPAIRNKVSENRSTFEWDCLQCTRRYACGLITEQSWYLRSEQDRNALAAFVDRENAHGRRPTLA